MSKLFKFYTLILIVFINHFNSLDSLSILVNTLFATGSSSKLGLSTSSGGKSPTNLPSTGGKSPTNLPSTGGKSPTNLPSTGGKSSTKFLSTGGKSSTKFPSTGGQVTTTTPKSSIQPAPPRYQTYHVSELCNQILNIPEGSAFFIKLYDYDVLNPNNNCRLTFQHSTFTKYYFFYTFQRVDISCINSPLRINSKSYCGYKSFSSENDFFYKGGSFVDTIALMLSTGTYRLSSSSFTVVATSYRDRPILGSCYSYEFLCDNGRCISNRYVCDSHNNCGDRSDEDFCYALTKGEIAGISVGVLTLIIVLIIVGCWQGRRRRMHIQYHSH